MGKYSIIKYSDPQDLDVTRVRTFWDVLVFG